MIASRSLLLASAAIGLSSVLYAAPRNAGANKAPTPAAPTAPVPENAGPAPSTDAPAPPLTGTAAAFAKAFEYEVEDNIPLPVKRVGVKGQSAYPYAKLAVNQSFFVPVSEKMAEPWKTLTSLSSRMSRDFWPKRFVTERQKHPKTGVDGVRVWRIVDGEGPVPEKRKSPEKKPADAVAGAAGPAATTETAATANAEAGTKVDASSDPTT